MASVCCADWFHAKLIGSSDHLRDGPKAHHRHDLTQMLRDEPHKVHDIFRSAAEALSQRLILCSDPGRAGVLRAHPHHHASHAHQRGRRKGEFFRPQKRRDRHIASAHQLSVRFQYDPAAQAVLHQTVMRFGKPKLPGQSRMMDRGGGSCSRSSVVTGNQDRPGACLGYAGGDRSYACLRDQLYTDPRIRVGVLQVVDQLRQVLDGIDIMMRRRRDQRNTGRGKPGGRDPGIDLSAGKMSSLPGFRALRHLDLDLRR